MSDPRHRRPVESDPTVTIIYAIMAVAVVLIIIVVVGRLAR